MLLAFTFECRMRFQFNLKFSKCPLARDRFEIDMRTLMIVEMKDFSLFKNGRVPVKYATKGNAHILSGHKRVKNKLPVLII